MPSYAVKAPARKAAGRALRAHLTDRLAQAVAGAGLRNSQVEKTLGLSVGCVSHWLAGRSLPNWDLIDPLCDLLGISRSWLFGEEQELRTSQAAEIRRLEIENMKLKRELRARR